MSFFQHEPADLQVVALSNHRSDDRTAQESYKQLRLAQILFESYQESKSIHALEECIRLYKNVLSLIPPSAAGHEGILFHLAHALFERYRAQSSPDDLQQCINYAQQYLELLPEDHPDRANFLSNLSTVVDNQCTDHGDGQNTEKQMIVQSQELKRCLADNPDRATTLINIANALGSQYACHGGEDDLNKQIELYTQSHELCSPGHPLFGASLSNLAFALKERYMRDGEEDDLHRWIDCLTQSLEIYGSGHPYHAGALANIAFALSNRYVRYEEEDDFDKCRHLCQQSLELDPSGSPVCEAAILNLATVLGDRYARNCKAEDLDKRIDLLTQSLGLRPSGHPARNRSLDSLLKALRERHARYGKEEDLSHALALLEGEVDTASTEIGMLRYALQWVDLAEHSGHDSLGNAFSKAVGCLRRYLSIGPTARMQYEAILRETRLTSLAIDAAAYFIERGDVEEALELLDEGRTLLWSEMRRFRLSLSAFHEERIGESLATRYRDLCEEIRGLSNAEVEFEDYVTPGNKRPSSAIKYDKLLKDKRDKLKEYDSLIEQIRHIPDCEDFQSRRRFSELQTAAKEGPVVVVNCSARRSDVIIVFADRAPSLKPLEASFRTNICAIYNAHTQRLDSIYNSFNVDFRTSLLAFSSNLEEQARSIWDLFVCGVVEELEKAGVPKQSRIWWSPTSVLTSLPIHAAGKGNGTDFLADHFISSYTTTLGALVDSRCNPTASSSLRMLLVAQTESSGLAFAKKEADLVAGLGSFVDRLDNEDATPASVIASLPSYNWVHFTCHGTVTDNPFDSCLLLHNGTLSLNDVIKAHVPAAQFAFLAACHTAKLNHGKVLQDEVMHLSAAMQLCGFRSVVGTMWSMEDQDGPALMKTFYRRMLTGEEGNEERHTLAAQALWKAVQKMRKRLPMARWANYVHIGA